MTGGHRLHKRSDLPLKLDSTGARFWEVHLERTMLTYFEVPPRTRFPAHEHESEQITHVVEGELYFELEGKTVCVGPGDTIAVPSMVRHAVFTGDSPARAFDAWSPVPARYRAGSE